jgi:ubiquinone/menaquinone biosynthesis C-methylase UbiE
MEVAVNHHRNAPGMFRGHPSRLYDLVARGPLRRLYRGLADEIAASAPQGGTVLDVGTGPGVLLVELARRRPDLQLLGVDLSPDMAATARRNVAEFADRVTITAADGAALPYPDDSVDLVVSTLSSHHWDHPDRVVDELARVVRPGGRVAIYDVPIAPFDAIEAEAGALFTGAAPRRSPIRTAIRLFPNYVRLELIAA